MKIVFFGTPDFSISSLESLIDSNFNISLVITQLDKPVGRKGLLSPSPVKKYALDNNIECRTPHSLKESLELIKELKEIQPDLGVVVAYGKIIPSDILNIFPKGVVNLHPSMLPKYRGPSPVQSAILNGDKETGISIMLLDEGMDSGPLLHQERYLINRDKNSGELMKEMFEYGANILSKTIQEYLNGNIKPELQNETEATITKKINHEDGEILFSISAEEIINKIKAFTPEPGAWFKYNNKKVLVKEAQVSNLNIEAGRLVINDKKLLIGTTTDAIELKILKPEGKNEMSGLDFGNGYKI